MLQVPCAGEGSVSILLLLLLPPPRSPPILLLGGIRASGTVTKFRRFSWLWFPFCHGAGAYVGQVTEPPPERRDGEWK